MLRVGMQPRRSASPIQILWVQPSVFCSSLSIEEQFFIKMIKSNQLKIITRDAGASGRHSHAGAWEREVLNLKIISTSSRCFTTH